MDSRGNNREENRIAIAAEGLRVSFEGTTVLSDFSFSVDGGECVLLEGPSGIGKTTVLKLIAGLEKPDAGTITFRPQTPSSIGMVFQEDRLAEHLSAVENLLLVNPSLQKEKARTTLAELLPAEELDKPVRLLSGGEKRRVCIVRALLADAPLLLLDEPFTGLDEKNHALAADFILCHRAGRTLILTSHDKTYLTGFREIKL